MNPAMRFALYLAEILAIGQLDAWVRNWLVEEGRPAVVHGAARGFFSGIFILLAVVTTTGKWEDWLPIAAIIFAIPIGLLGWQSAKDREGGGQ